MRVSWEGDQLEALFVLRRAKHALYLLEQRLSSQGLTYGSFHQRLSDTAHCYGYVLPTGLKAIHIVAKPDDTQVAEQGSYFEFFTPGLPVTTRITHLLADFLTYKAATIGVDPTTAEATIRGGDRLYNTQADSRIGRTQQLKLFDEPVAYSTTYTTALYESWAPGHSHTGLHLRCWNLQQGGLWSNRGPLSAHTVRDIGFDVPYEDGRGLSLVRQAYVRDSADWPRANGIQSVKHSTWGVREFGVYIDSFNRFHVFPLSAIGPLDTVDPTLQNVDADSIRHLTPTLPAWAYKPTMSLSDWWDANATVGLIDFPEADWKVHPNATEACAIFYQREAANFDSAYFAVDQGASPFDATQFATYRDGVTGVASRHMGLFDPSYLTQRYNAGPGLVRVAINIVLTGPGQNDYTADAVVSEVRTPTGSEYCTFLAGYCWHDIKAEDFTEANQHYVAKSGDMVVLDIERHFKPSTASISSFMSLKNLTAPRVGEIRAFFAAALVDYDLPTLSFVFTLPWITSYFRSLDRRAGAPGSGPVVEQYSVSNFGLNIWTLNTHREVLFPDTIDATAKANILFYAPGSPRSIVSSAGWELMPLNDLREWSDPDLGNLRDYYTTAVFHYKSVSYSTPSTPLLNWWTTGMFANLATTGLFYLDKPRFGWHVYTDEIINRLHVTPYSTFFAHPDGTWAFYDQQYVYNKHGMATGGPSGIADQLGAFDETQLEHCILDRVHFANGKDTSFVELYNDAVARGTESSSLTEVFDPIARSDLRASFTKQTYTDGGSGVSWLQLKIDWPPSRTAYYMETGYEGGAYNTGSTSGAGGLKDLNMGDLFWTEPGYGGDSICLHDVHSPVTFSSCTLVS